MVQNSKTKPDSPETVETNCPSAYTNTNQTTANSSRNKRIPAMKRFLHLNLGLLFLLGFSLAAPAEVLTIEPTTVTEWKAVYGEVEARERVPARARIGGTISELDTTEGEIVEAGQRLALVTDDKLAFRLEAVAAQLAALNARLDTAESDLKRGEELFKRGVITTQRLDQLRTEVDVLKGQIKSVEADRLVIQQQVNEGEVLSPEDGLVLSVPVSKGSVINPGEPIAVIGGGGMFLRLSVPERHATSLVEGDKIEIGATKTTKAQTGRLAKIYPQIIGGRVQADVEVPNLETRFVGRRILVRLPVGEHKALLVPAEALTMVGGVDFVSVKTGEKTVRRAVVPGVVMQKDGRKWREILSGLVAGDQVVIGDE